VRQILPPPGAGPSAGQLGPADLIRSADPITPAAAGRPGVEELIAALGAHYAYPAEGTWVRANMIASVDGAISLDGRSGGLSGAGDRLMFWVLRSLADVILVGAGTARAERYGPVRPVDLWPSLRYGRAALPPIAVITRHLDLDLDGRLFGYRGESARPIVLTTAAAPKDKLAATARVAEVIVAGEDDVPAAAAVDALASRGHHRILTEGGPGLLGQLADGGLLDELCLTISPILEGGHSPGRVAVAPQGGQGKPTALRLASLLEDDGFLFSRYVRASAP
jgi:riboflavin biosynthesis pyrimidine reductase